MPDDSGSGGLPRLGLVLLVLITLGWGIAWPAMKIVLNEMSPWTFRATTIPLAGLIMMALARLSGQPLAVPRHQWRDLLIVASINVGGWQLFSALGLDHLSSGRAVLVAYTMPVWASLAAAFLLGEALTGRLIAALILGMAGVAVLLVGDFATIGEAPLGVAFMLAAAFSWGLGIALLKRVAWRVPTLSLAAWQLLIAGLLITAVSAMLDEIHFPPLTPPAWGMLVFVVLIPICFCTYAFFKVVSLFPANVSAIGTLMIPVVGVVSGSLLLGEPIGWRELLSMALIGSAMVLTLLFPTRRKRQ